MNQRFTRVIIMVEPISDHVQSKSELSTSDLHRQMRLQEPNLFEVNAGKTEQR